jgi:hypothetical protein
MAASQNTQHFASEEDKSMEASFDREEVHQNLNNEEQKQLKPIP